MEAVLVTAGVGFAHAISSGFMSRSVNQLFGVLESFIEHPYLASELEKVNKKSLSSLYEANRDF